jgi:hypothetical protein
MERTSEKQIIADTMTNMSSIYRDIGIILQLIDRSMKDWDIRPQGDTGAVWDVSSSYENTENWLYRWFARAYTKTDSRTVVGPVIHLGGYNAEWIRKMRYFSVEVPCVQVSLLQYESLPNVGNRANLYNDLWGLSWYDPNAAEKIGNVIVVPSVKSHTGPAAKVTSYFVDLLSVRSKEQIEQLLAEPMRKMLEGKWGWVNDMKLPVMNIDIQT